MPSAVFPALGPATFSLTPAPDWEDDECPHHSSSEGDSDDDNIPTATVVKKRRKKRKGGGTTDTVPAPTIPDPATIPAPSLGEPPSNSTASSSAAPSAAHTAHSASAAVQSRKLTKTELRKRLSFDELLLEFEELVRKAANEPHCTNHPGCKCLHPLRDATFCSPVALSLAKTSRSMKKDEKDQFLLIQYRYASGAPKVGTDFTNWFVMPVDGSTAKEEGIDVSPLLKLKICTSAMRKLYEIGSTRMNSIRSAAHETGVVKGHGNKGRSMAIKEEDPRMPPIRAHFNHLLGLGEVRATRFIRKLVEGKEGATTTATRDDPEDEMVYLPTTSGFRPMYYRYMQEQGYKVTVCATGAVSVTWIESDEERLPYISLSTYYRIWKRDYPQMKVSRASEDLCGMCVQFRNRHHYLATHTRSSPGDSLNAVNDDELFIESEDEDADAEGGKQAKFKKDAFKKDVTAEVGKPSEKPQTNANKPGDAAEPTAEGDIVVCGALESEEEDAILPRTLKRRAEKSRERMLLRAAVHVSMARVQRELYVKYVEMAWFDAKAKKPHSSRSYCFVVDFGQNMELPVFHSEQPGPVYYYSPLGIYDLGMVNHAHTYPDGTVAAHMYTHVYHEGVGRKASNNVASLIMKTLKLLNLLRDDEMGGELTIVFDNCQGQNKNNTVLKLMAYLTEMGYFARVNFVFLIVGHTKNSADHHFNCLKLSYHKGNIFTMDDMLAKLNESDKVTVIPTKESDFLDYDAYLSHFYRDFVKKVQVNHIFSATHQESRVKNKFVVDIRRSDLPEHEVDAHDAIKRNFEGKQDYPTFADAVNNRKKIMKDLEGKLLKMLTPPGINIYKQVELYLKYKPLIPQEFWTDPLYKKPLKHIVDAVKKEKKDRKVFREDLNAMKLSAQRKDVKAQVEEIAMGKGQGEGQAEDETMEGHSV